VPIKLKSLVKPIKYPMCLGPGCIHIREYSKEELELLLNRAGLRSIRIRGVWLGLRGRFEMGTTKFPKKLEKIFTSLASKGRKVMRTKN